MPNRNPRQADTQKQPPMPGRSDVGKDTDGDGRVVQPGHQAEDVDGDRQRKAQSGNSVGKDN